MGETFRAKLEQNSRVRIDLPIWMLIFLECYSVWQFGVIYFSGRSFSVMGGTTLPVNVESTEVAVAAGGVVAVLLVLFFQRYAATIIRIGAPAALLCNVLLLFPLPEGALLAAVYGGIFLCMALFGCCHGLIILLFSEKTALYQAAVTTLLLVPFVAVLQNGTFSVPFDVFSILSVLLLGLFWFAAWRLPGRIPVVFAEAEDRGQAPGLLLAGLLFLVFVATLTMEMALATAESVAGGVPLTYGASFVGALVFLLLWKKGRRSAIGLLPLFLAVSCAGFILAAASSGIGSLHLSACALIGFGFIVFAMVAYVGQWVFRLYPSHWLLPAYMGTILLAVMVHSAALEALRDQKALLCAVYGAAAAILLVVYLIIEPYLAHQRRRQLALASVGRTAGAGAVRTAAVKMEAAVAATAVGAAASAREAVVGATAVGAAASAVEAVVTVGTAEAALLPERPATNPKRPSPVPPEEEPHPFEALTERERQVAELLLQGYTGGGIARQLCISENTVATHRKEIYRKLSIHSKRELFQVAARNADFPVSV